MMLTNEASWILSVIQSVAPPAELSMAELVATTNLSEAEVQRIVDFLFEEGYLFDDDRGTVIPQQEPTGLDHHFRSVL